MEQFNGQNEALEITSPETARPDTIEVDDLIAQRDALKNEIDCYAGEKGEMDRDWKIISEMTEEEISPYFQKMLGRVYAETPALREIEDSIGKDNLMSNLGQGKFATRVQFEKNTELGKPFYANYAKYQVMGRYFHNTKEIFLKDKAPNQKEIWACLLYRRLPPVLESLDHEINHYWFYREREKHNTASQPTTEKIKTGIEAMKSFIKSIYTWRPFKSIKYDKQETRAEIELNEAEKLSVKMDFFREVMSPGTSYGVNKTEEILYKEKQKKKEGLIISETIAHKATNINCPRSGATVPIIEKLTSAYGFKGKGALDRMITAAQAVDRFRVLGFSDKEIAEAFGSAIYDAKSASYPSVQKKIEELAAEKGLSMEELDTEADIMRVKKDLYMYQVAKIAQEEFSRLAEEKRNQK